MSLDIVTQLGFIQVRYQAPDADGTEAAVVWGATVAGAGVLPAWRLSTRTESLFRILQQSEALTCLSVPMPAVYQVWEKDDYTDSLKHDVHRTCASWPDISIARWLLRWCTWRIGSGHARCLGCRGGCRSRCSAFKSAEPLGYTSIATIGYSKLQLHRQGAVCTRWIQGSQAK